MDALSEVSCLDATEGDVWTEAFPLPVGFVIPSLSLSGDTDPHADISNGSSPYLPSRDQSI
jgi:hypothetical protein